MKIIICLFKIVLLLSLVSCATVLPVNDEGLTVYDKLFSPSKYGTLIISEKISNSPSKYEAHISPERISVVSYYPFSIYHFDDGSYVLTKSSRWGKNKYFTNDYFYFVDASALMNSLKKMESGIVSCSKTYHTYLLGNRKHKVEAFSEDFKAFFAENGLTPLYEWDKTEGFMSRDRRVQMIYLDVSDSYLAFHLDRERRLTALQLVCIGNKEIGMEPLEYLVWERGLSGWLDQAKLAVGRYHQRSLDKVAYDKEMKAAARRTLSQALSTQKKQPSTSQLIAEAAASAVQDLERDLNNIYETQKKIGKTSTIRMSSVDRTGSNKKSVETEKSGSSASTATNNNSSGKRTNGVILHASGYASAGGQNPNVDKVKVAWGPDSEFKTKHAAEAEANRIYNEMYNEYLNSQRGSQNRTVTSNRYRTQHYPPGWVKSN